jgi:hypothetical protein
LGFVWRIGLCVFRLKGDLLEMAKEQGVLEAAHSERAKNLWLRLAKLWSVSEEHRIMAGRITEIRIKRPRFEGDEVMVIVKAVDDSRLFVAFSTGLDAPTALASALARAEQQVLKWREDQYGVQPGASEHPLLEG